MWNKNCWLVIGLCLLPLQAASEEIVLDTPQGKLLGISSKEEKEKIFIFKGIPYAIPPVGDRRWKPPEPARKWRGERLAQNFSPECMQPPFAENDFHYRPVPQMSEDCLYLNVWAPKKTEKTYPVMVWIHGGSLVEGAGSGPAYDGSELARKNVVVVAINYRLDIFGYFSHPELTAESPNNASGNYGTLDQIQALKWVRKNVAAFGGDPNNVTIFGESAGALSVAHLLISPLSNGLFHRAILQSPYLKPMPALKDRQYGKLPAEVSGSNTARRLRKQSLEGLRGAPASDILQASIDSGFFPEAVVDNWVFSDQMFRVFEQGRQHDVPLLLGYNSGEGYHLSAYPDWLPPKPESKLSYIKEVESRYGNLSEKYLAIYPPDDLREAVYAPIRDGFYGWAAQKIARASKKLKSEAYLYYFDHPPEWSRKIGMGAFHSSELPYMFNNVRHNLKYGPRWPDYSPNDSDIKLAEIMSDYWVAFAKNGSPRTKGRPRWIAYNDRAESYMLFKNGSSYSKESLHSDAFAFHEHIFNQRKLENQSWGLSSIGLLAPVLSSSEGKNGRTKENDFTPAQN